MMEDNGFATCPFNPAHRMLKLRLQYHIVKCQKNYMTAGMKPCPYNATHIIRTEEYRQHIQNCPDFVLIEGHRYNDDKPHGKLNDGAFHFDVTNEDDDWEAIGDVTDTCSEVSANSSKESAASQYIDLLADYDEDDEPLQRYFFEEKKSQRFPDDIDLGSPENSNKAQSSRENNPNDGEIDEREGKMITQCGAGRGRLLSILAGLNNR